ncbi:T9SS type A sorting domain-containing protein [Aliifodinibius sp. S!AR15-10]|uniref:T9SS type A sorting domain-containing protein n=1 Tax=Aliifodinibius sp. S!AR15-10 TaxID=2950437 RepID=UPI0028560AEB|nr:T9SS type A sorting domain-containing protein [Aliifodinibius sp. S!AR15-10]MDR8393539.1 T9SS type A sorting domain-containing protein [Aliifodinibius sp. S!AR15-10]
MKNVAKRPLYLIIFLTLSAVVITTAFWGYGNNETGEVNSEESYFKFEEKKEEGASYSKIQTKVARSRYFFRMLRDPKMNAIPPNIRNRELNLARMQPTRDQYPMRIKRKDGTIAELEYEWEEAGPFDVGGRTRALGIDRTDPNVVIAGGTSGGIWKSTDGGTTWELKTDPSQHMSVTSLAQDPTSPNTWYYTSGELRGNTASDRSGSASYYGTGVFKSTDNGETWSKIPTTDDNDETFNSPYDFITRVVVSPTTGSVFIASNGIGIYRSTSSEPFPSSNGGIPNSVLGTIGGHRYCDIAVGTDGRLIAVLSSVKAGAQGGNPGVFVSYDDGDSWTEITSDIENFPNSHQRSVIDIAPSAPDTAYIMTYVGGSSEDEDVRLHFVDLTDHQNDGTIQSEDRTQHIPDFGGEVGFMSTQSNYNMEIAVKPDDPDFVTIGGINLFRSRDGFSSSPTLGYGETNKDEHWIGGYAKTNNITRYPQQHPDQHVVTFEPGNPDVAWTGHDGGLSKTTDITASSVSWEQMNNGYVTTQFYAVDIPEQPGDDRLMGGTQDNGTPFFRFDSQQSQQTQPAENIFTGDGGYSFFTPIFFYVSAQNGIVLRRSTDSNGNPGAFSYVHPSQASNQFFIHPYVVDPNGPNNNNIMYYPDSDTLWRNTQVGEISGNSSSGTSEGWEIAAEVSSLTANQGYQISTLEVSKVPSDVLYFGAFSPGGPPAMFRMNNASSSGTPEDISIPGAANGSYPHDIAINPSNGNELLAIFSNYGVPSVFHSTDGGDTWQDVEGNLDGVNTMAGPSVRSATIIPGESGTIYLLGTSTGIYSTTNLDDDTKWIQEGSNSIGFTVVEYLASRTTDGTIAAGSHGRGIFKGNFQGTVANSPAITLQQAEARSGQEVTITSVNFSFNTEPEENDVLFGEVPAEVVDASANQLTVVVPRISSRVKKDDSVVGNNLVQIKVTAGGQTVTYASTFEILPPEEFELGPNFPNPFNPTTTIPVDLPSESGVIIQVFDMSGRKVLEPVRRVYEPNNYNFEVDLSGLASGVYIYRVVAIPQDGSGDSIIKTRKMTLIK